ncbi:MAG: protein translocase subunit SecF [Alphaproteobacteria bacterium]|nr:protein translocase subunit SecF [Alphaproteobacteria bacterium]
MLCMIKCIPQETKINFLGKRFIAFALSALLIIASIGSITTKGLNLGIDFTGGLLLEVKTNNTANIAGMRKTLSELGLGDVALQGIGESGNEVMIRVQGHEGGDEKSQKKNLDKIKEALGDRISEYRRIEMVGPQVGSELIKDGILAVTFAILAIIMYIWFRFELPFAIGGMIALSHDVIATVGIFSILGMDFNLTTIAAILTIAGYSINDTVVSFDRVRENLGRFKKMDIPELLNLSINDMLSRTMLTSLTTLLAVVSIYLFGGEVLKGFAFAMIWGVIIGTYSSMYIAMPFLTYFDIRTSTETVGFVPSDTATKSKNDKDDDQGDD